jgi:Arc/MetJ family transcription regulator
MPKTLIDIDDDLLARAAAHLGTATPQDTVNAALGLVVRAAAFDAFSEFVAEGGLADLSDDVPVGVEDLRRSAEAFQDLDDAAVMGGAWE